MKIVCQNKKARHDYFLEERFEAGLALQGWEVKSLREGRVQLTESYVILQNGEAWLFGFHIAPLLSASTHITPDPTRSRKLLLHRKELDKLIKAAETAWTVGLRVNAGHGLTYHNVQPVASIPGLEELNIGHSIISRAVITGIFEAVREMKRLIVEASRTWE